MHLQASNVPVACSLKRFSGSASTPVALAAGLHSFQLFFFCDLSLRVGKEDA